MVQESLAAHTSPMATDHTTAALRSTPTFADDLQKLKRDVYSQNGEDGIIEWIFTRIPPRHRVCVEFGAWDGRALSNTFKLVAHDRWRAVYIEADRSKYESLKRTAAAYPAITPVCSLVTTAGESSLDTILERHNVPAEFDLLSIDIDGNDYDVWDATVRFRPTLVIVECNMTFPAEFEYVDHDGRCFIGSSAASLAALASRKGYGLLGCAGSNLFFLREQYFPLLGLKPQTVDAALGHKPPCYVFFNYAGEIVFSDSAVAQKLRGVSYAQPLKTWVRRALRMPSFYVLGVTYPEGGAVLKFLRWMKSHISG
jgi:hypothetical protein